MKDNNGMVYRVATKEEGTSYARTRAFVDALNTGDIGKVMNEVVGMSKNAINHSDKFADAVKDHENRDLLIRSRQYLVDKYAGSIVKNKDGQFGLVVQSSHSNGYAHLSVIVLDGTEVLRETTWSLGKIDESVRKHTERFLMLNYNLEYK